MATDPTPDSQRADESPPVLGSWKAIYAVVLINLGVLVALFYALTKVYG